MTAMQGVIVKGIGGFYYALAGDAQTYTLRARGVFRKRKITPLVGDAIRFTPGVGEEEGWIDEILARSNELSRPPVANLSYLIIVVAPQPKPDLLLADALLIEAGRQRISPVLVINKHDLDASMCRDLRAQYADAGGPVILSSVKTGEGLEALEEVLKRGICCFAGQSGVGKSSLVAAITGLSLEVGEISQKISRGKHTTRHAELLVHGGYQVLDTAGFSLLWQAGAEDPVRLKSYYPEFVPLEGQCRFQPCYHQNEPGCAVLRARDEGRIPKERVGRYHQLLGNAKEAWENRYD